jgi:hypothetical protein
MANNDSQSQPPHESKKGKSWDWLWPTITAVIVVRLFGLVGGLVTLGAFYWLKPNIGTWGAVVVGGVVGVLSAIAFGAMLRA